MQLSIFDVLGPVMIGPSSSHTAGAVKLARVAALIAHKPFTKVRFALSGSFFKTGVGHGTHKALLAGALGLMEDDEAIFSAESLAIKQNIQAEYDEEDLEYMHENSVHMTFYHKDNTTSEVWGASIGGGRIEIRRIGNFSTKISAENPTLVVRHLDRPGVVGDVSRVLAEGGMNIAVMRLGREARGKGASVVIELDGIVPPEIVEKVRALAHVMEVIAINVP